MTKPTPRIAERDREFWDGCARGELHVQQCTKCGEHWFPSQDRCPSCRSTDTSWVKVGTSGTVYTFTVIHGPGTEGRPSGFEDDYPYAVGVVEIDGGGGARIAGSLTGVPLDELRIGMRVEASFADGEARLPEFRAADRAEAAGRAVAGRGSHGL